MTVRLASVAPDLVDALSGVSEARLRTVARQVASWAAEEAGLTSDVAVSALAQLREWSSDRSVVSADLEREVRGLDEEAWQIQELAERDESEEGDERKNADYVRVFSRARAASALWFALQESPRTAAVEAVYEAYAATGDLDRLRAIVEKALHGS